MSVEFSAVLVERHRAHFDRAKERVRVLGAIQQQQRHALFDADIQRAPQRVAKAIDVLQKLVIGDALIGEFDSDFSPASLGYVAIHEVGCDVEVIGDRRGRRGGHTHVDGGHSPVPQPVALTLPCKAAIMA